MALVDLTQRARKPATKYIQLCTYRLGTRVKIFFPHKSNSIYNDEDSDYEYSENPDWEGQLLMTQLIQEGQSNTELDMILAEVEGYKIITPYNFYFGMNSDKPIYDHRCRQIFSSNGLPQYQNKLGTLIELDKEDYITELPLNAMIAANLTMKDNVSQGLRLRIDTITVYGNHLYKLYNLVPME
nr:MAG TPA: hypothetical protein [Bacteriophage sp.]